MHGHISDEQILKKYKICKNGQLFLFNIKNLVAYAKENIALQVKLLIYKFRRVTFNGNMQT